MFLVYEKWFYTLHSEMKTIVHINQRFIYIKLFLLDTYYLFSLVT